MTALHKLFVRVHGRYTRSTHVADLTAFARWLIEHEYAARYSQRLVFRALRSLEGSDRPPGSKWTVDALQRTFRRGPSEAPFRVRHFRNVDQLRKSIDMFRIEYRNRRVRSF